MSTLKIEKKKISLNKIENFVEDICEKFNIKNSFQGNIIIAVSEMISIIDNLDGEGNLTFRNGEKEFEFRYEINSISLSEEMLFNNKRPNVTFETDYEKSIFLIMALCDDFRINEENNTLAILFEKEGIINDISSHRREYLKNYLGRTIKSVNRENE